MADAVELVTVYLVAAFLQPSQKGASGMGQPICKGGHLLERGTVFAR